MNNTADELDLYRFITIKPEIDYLARDYTSFRQLMLDHFSVLLPNWQEESAADLGQLLIDLLAYTADYLSYYQDAAATEAYLGTARLRRSVRRHARLLDYFLHEGCNARAWIHVEVNAANSGKTLPRGALMLTDAPGLTPGPVEERLLPGAVGRGAEVFATLHDLRLWQECNQLDFHVANARTEGVLRRGETRAYLAAARPAGGRLLLSRGDVLLFEETRDPESGDSGRANPRRRHIVRLTKVYPAPGHSDKPDKQVLGIEWAEGDALPFDLYLTSPYGRTAAAVARGNMVLVDHGRLLDRAEELPPVPARGSYRPLLRHPNLTFSTPYDHAEALTLPARHAIDQDPQRAMPQIEVSQLAAEATLDADSPSLMLPPAGHLDDARGDWQQTAVLRQWKLRRDLLDSEPFAPDYVVEMEAGAVAYLGFGFNNMGLKPEPGDRYVCRYRIGNGSSGNVGRDTIVHLIENQAVAKLDLHAEPRIQIRNPLPAQGGVNAGGIEEARLYAPAAFRAEPDACIIDADYARLAKRYPGVANAAARMDWTGATRTVFIYIRRDTNEPLTRDFRRRLRAFLEPYRSIGAEVEIRDPQLLPLTIELRITRRPGVPEQVVKEAVQQAFDTREHEDGTRGFFAPANFDFGKPVYRNNVIATAMRVPGVMNVQVLAFRPIDNGRALGHEHLGGDVIRAHALEIIELRNDPAHPEHGAISFTFVEGA